MIKIEKRTEKLEHVREAKKVPGVIYGKTLKSTPIQVDYKDFVQAYHEYGRSMTFKVKLGSKSHHVYFKDLQIDPLNHNNFFHFDLQKVSASDTITADIALHVLNKDLVEKKGLVVQILDDTLETEFPVGEGVSSIEIDVEGLEGGDAIYVKDIVVPEGFAVLEDPEKMVINVSFPSYDEEEEDTEDTEEEVEVEAIKQKDADEE